jgi:hypothetical protein
MTRPRIIDTFMFSDELDMLECRLTEIGDVVDWVVIVEADVTHQDRPKPYYFLDNVDRFRPWADKIVHVKATGLPTAAENPDAWSRETGQREFVAAGLDRIGVNGNDIILHGDVDEIPRPFHVRTIRPAGLMAFGMRFHPFAVDWLHPEDWRGTVAGTAATVRALGPRMFSKMRDTRNFAPCPPHMRDAGHHFTWVGGNDYAWRKLAAFCHPEIERQVVDGLTEDTFYREGWHVDGHKLAAVDVDDTWPRWIVDGHAPSNWFRPR